MLKRFELFAEGRDQEEKYKQAIFVQLGINPEHAQTRMDDSMESFSNSNELEKMAVLDDLDPDVKMAAIAAMGDGDTTVRDLIRVMSRNSDVLPGSSDKQFNEPEPPTHAIPGGASGPAAPSPM